MVGVVTVTVWRSEGMVGVVTVTVWRSEVMVGVVTVTTCVAVGSARCRQRAHYEARSGDYISPAQLSVGAQTDRTCAVRG